VITPTEAAITSTAEPVAAAAGALLFLGIALLPLQYAGGAAILVAVVLLRREATEPPPPPPS
jgi:drug/metabolite transporter (DMT)-like permease